MAALGVQTVFDHADYRLLSRRAIQYLDQFNEVNLFLRGVIPMLGLRSTIVHYDRRARFAGESKYPLRKMVEFALNGVTSFSTAPLRAIALLGFAVSLVCLLLAGWALFVKLTSPHAVPGWASTILPIYFLGGIQLFCAGVLGEYVGKIYMEIKRRPRFLIERVAQAPQHGGFDSERDTRGLLAPGRLSATRAGAKPQPGRPARRRERAHATRVATAGALAPAEEERSAIARAGS